MATGNAGKPLKVESWKNNYFGRFSEDVWVKCFFPFMKKCHLSDFWDFMNEIRHKSQILGECNDQFLHLPFALYVFFSYLPSAAQKFLLILYFCSFFYIYDSSWDWEWGRAGRRATLGTGTNEEIMKKVSLGRRPKQSRQLPSNISLAQHFFERELGLIQHE